MEIIDNEDFNRDVLKRSITMLLVDLIVMTIINETLQIICLKSKTEGSLHVLDFLEIYPTRNSLLRINI